MQCFGFGVRVRPETLRELDNARDGYAVRKQIYENTPNKLGRTIERLTGIQMNMLEQAYTRYTANDMTAPLEMRENSPLTERKANKLLSMFNTMNVQFDDIGVGKYNSPEKERESLLEDMHKSIREMDMAILALARPSISADRFS